MPPVHARAKPLELVWVSRPWGSAHGCAAYGGTGCCVPRFKGTPINNRTSINRNGTFGTDLHFGLSPHMLSEKLGLHPASSCFSRF